MPDTRQHDDNFIREENARHLWHPMAHPADSQASPPTIVTKGKGVYITDLDGHRVIDAVGGLWNVNLGFSCDPIKQAIAGQLDRLPYYSIFRGTTNDVAVELSHELAQFFAPDGLQRAFYTSGGDSVETALRLARQYHKIRGDAGRVKFISLKKAITAHTSAAPASTGTRISAPSTNHCFPAAITSRRPTPIATRSARRTRRALPSCVHRPLPMKSPSGKPKPSPPLSWNPFLAPAA